MSAQRCSRVWQAEAVLDGVLSRADSASFERHAATCADCSVERVQLARLASVAQRLPSVTVTPLRRRALHNELLRRANELSVGAQPSRPSRLWLWTALAASAVVTLLVVWRLSAPTPTARGAAPSFELSAAANSRWRVARPGPALRLSLELGTVTISVAKLGADQRFSLQLPDGELEVRGTRFTIECDAARTRRVVVDEGRVVLRLAGQAELSLGPGEGWPRPTARSPAGLPAPAASGSPGADLASSTRAAPSGSAPPLAAPQRQGATRRQAATKPSGPGSVVSAPPATPSAAVAARSAAARDFAEAMAVFSGGDFGSAERMFRAFEERYPSSPHREDLLFLRALGRSRRGDAGGARALAREYLNRYPEGFRAHEARELAREPAPRRQLRANPDLVTFP